MIRRPVSAVYSSGLGQDMLLVHVQDDHLAALLRSRSSSISSPLLWCFAQRNTHAPGVCTLLGALCHGGLLPALRSALRASPQLSPLRQAAEVRPPLPLPGV